MRTAIASLLLVVFATPWGLAPPTRAQGPPSPPSSTPTSPSFPPTPIVATTTFPSAQARERLGELLFDYTVFELPVAAILEQMHTPGRLQVALGSRSFDLDLAPSHLLDAGYRRVLITRKGEVEVPSGREVAFRGTANAEQGSVVRLTATPSLLTGYIQTAEEWLFIDPLADYTDGAAPGQVVVYRDVDVRPEARGQCGSGHLLVAASLGPSTASSGSSTRWMASIATRSTSISM